MNNLIFLKLGGSLITDKNKPHTPRMEILLRVANEIKSALNHSKDLTLLIGHGSGSFGHVPAKEFNTREGVTNLSEWIGFHKVWRQARDLNQIVVEVLSESGIPIISFSPSASIVSNNRKLLHWTIDPIIQILDAGLIPLIHGDVIIDKMIGGTIFSTEELFLYLANFIQPNRILLAGIEPGVWADYPACTSLCPEISVDTFHATRKSLKESISIDVTGGMLEKVKIILDIIKRFPACEGAIFSGLKQGNIKNALLGEKIGTQLISEGRF